ncbi:MAG: nicotinate phosphoribosyltransferase [Prevotellaceae bacterium]|jgi:nicotinate phosphoribosyltransferase|nr:nicotinate phosphoribosyltransferase [Prevotellaceae bacterium]
MENTPFCSDKYQYTMSKTFFDSGLYQKEAIFNLFFREAPDKNNWAVVSGTRDCIEVAKALGGKSASFFESFLPGPHYESFRQWLSHIRFTGDIWAMEEGEIAFPRQPVVIVKAPLVEAQILETPLLCILNHQMGVATKASRVTRSTNKPVSEFGSRRAHGPWAAEHGAKAAYIGGCIDSSNILGKINYDVPCSGTMAHSYVTAFGCTPKTEQSAFETYIQSHLGEPLFLLIDTYDTLRSGIHHAISAFAHCGINDQYSPIYGVRLDSGDLAYLSIECRKLLDSAGLHNCKIIASNALDEYLIADLERQQAQIDMYGVGDTIATSKHNPCFGNVYKMVQIGDQPLLKRSEDKSKVINPGFQHTYRIIQHGEYKADVTCLVNDKLSQAIEAGADIVLRDETDESKQTHYEAHSYEFKILQKKMMENGTIIAPDVTIHEKRTHYLENLHHLNPTERRIVNPHYHKVDISDDLIDLKTKLLHEIHRELKPK